MSLAQQLQDERKALSVKMGELLRSTNLNTQASREQYATWDTAQEALRVRIASIRQDGIERDARSNPSDTNRRNMSLPNVNDVAPQHQRAHREYLSSEKGATDFENFLRGKGMSPEMRAIAAGSSPLVPTGFSNELEQKIIYYNGIYNIARLVRTETGNPLNWPVASDESNTGEWLGEAAGVGSADPTFSTVTLGANKLSSKQVKFSVELEQDSAFPLVSFLADELGVRMGQTLDTALWSGDGSTIPITGLKTALVAAGGRSVLALGANGNSGSGSDTTLNSVGTDDLSNLIDKLNYAYQKPSNRFIFNQTTLNSLRKMKDKYGRPIWNVSLAVGEPDTLLGYDYTVDNALSNPGAGNVSVCFGDFSKYVVRRCLDFTLIYLDQLYMANYQRAVQALMRIDAKLLNANAFSILTHPLS